MDNSIFLHNIPTEKKYGIKLKILRLDLLHPVIQGNKYFKLLYNLEYALQDEKAVVTMGGPHSNHIYATALACNSEKIPSYGIIRGSNFKFLSPTLQRSQDLGMNLIYSDRNLFRNIREENGIGNFIDELEYDGTPIPEQHHFIPEGGSNRLGVQGAREILENISLDFDYVFVPVGTGGTISGIISYLEGEKIIVGIAALADDSIVDKVKDFTNNSFKNWQINYNYHFGGYALWNMKLINFINDFKEKFEVPLCPIYTGKMMYAIFDLLEKNYFQKGKTILVIHTGGLQGIEGFNQANNDILN